jgi:bacterioferritin (cytochrome b1)
MQLSDMISKLNDDLKNEWKHLQFYLHHASAITGLHAHEYKEFLLEQAEGEMKHVGQFSDLLFGLGATPTTDINEFPKLTSAKSILECAAAMEEEVVNNYVQRIAQLSTLTFHSSAETAHAKWIEIFLEEQIKDSREDLDHLMRILEGHDNA